MSTTQPIAGSTQEPHKLALNKVLRDGLVYLPSQVLPSLLGFISVPIFTRIFSPTQYGQVSIVGSIVAFLLVGIAWIQESSMRFYPVYRGKAQQSVFFCVVVLSMLVACASIAALSVPLLHNLPSVLPIQLVGLTVSIFIAEATFKQGLNLLRVAQKANAYTVFVTVFSIAKLALSILLVFIWKREITSLLIAWIFTDLALLPFIVKALSIGYHFGSVKFKDVISGVKSFIDYGSPYVVSAATWAILDIVDRFFVQYYKGSAEVGLYSIGYIPNIGFSFIFTMVAFASYPIIVDVWERDGHRATQQLLQDLLHYYLVISIPFLVGIAVVAKEILSVVTSPQYVIAYQVVPLVAVGGFFQGLLPFVTKSFVLHKRSSLNMVVGLSGAGFNVLLNFVLIPKYGFLGAGLATALSYFVVVILAVVISEKVLNFKPRVPYKSVLKILTASLGMAGCVYLAKSWCQYSNGLIGLVLEGFVGVSVYVVFLLVFGEISPRSVYAILYGVSHKSSTLGR